METRNSLLYGAALITVILWGTAYTLIGYIVDYMSPAWLVAVRVTIAAVVLTGYALLRGHRFPPLRDPVWRWYWVIGFFGMTFPFYLSAKGQMSIDSGLTAVIAGVMPLITIVLAHFFIKGEHLSWRKGLGFLIGFAGIVFLFIPIPLKWNLVDTWQAQGLILIMAFSYALVTIIVKRAPKTPASVGAAMMLISASIMALAWAFSTGIPETRPPNSALLAIVFLALGGTGVAQILYLRIIEVKGPSFIAKMVYVVPIFSIISGIIFLDEPFSWRSILALMVIFAGLLIARAGEKKITNL